MAMQATSQRRRGGAPGQDLRDHPHPAPRTPEERRALQLRRLGDAVLARADEVLAETVERTKGSGEHVDPQVQESFERICTNSTVAVARWIAGDDLEVTNESARETSHIFGELAAHRAASLQEVTRRMFWWRNVFGDVMRDAARGLRTPQAVLRDALDMLQLSVEFSLLRMCQCYEKERMVTDEQLARREEELAFMATHDPLTDLPNRTLIVDRIGSDGRPRGAQRDLGRGAVHRPRQLQDDQRHARARDGRPAAAGGRRPAPGGAARRRRARPSRRRRVRRARRRPGAGNGRDARRRTPARRAQAALQARRGGRHDGRGRRLDRDRRRRRQLRGHAAARR